MDSYLATKRNEVLIHITMWVNHESILLSEKKSVTKGCIQYESIAMKCPKQANIEIESRLVVFPGLRGRNEEGRLAYGISFGDNENVQKLILVMATHWVVLVVKNLPANARDIRDMGFIPGLGRSPGGGHSNPFQYSCLENLKDRGAWWATVHRVGKLATFSDD